MATKKKMSPRKKEAAKKKAPAKKAAPKKAAAKKTALVPAAGPADPMGCCTWTNSAGQIQRRDMRKSQCTFTGAVFVPNVSCT